MIARKTFVGLVFLGTLMAGLGCRRAEKPVAEPRRGEQSTTEPERGKQPAAEARRDKQPAAEARRKEQPAVPPKSEEQPAKTETPPPLAPVATPEKSDKPDNWDHLHKVAEALALRASQLGGKEWKLPKLDYKKFPSTAEPLPADCSRQKIRTDGLSTSPLAIHDCLLVSGASIAHVNSLVRSIVFINGDLKGGTRIHDCLVFCDGNIGRITDIHNSIILATGTFAGATSADNSFFQVKDIEGNNQSQGNVYLNLKSVRCVTSRNDRFPRDDKGPLQATQIFHSTDPGIELSQAGEQVRIDKVDDGSRFAQAGLRAGDIVLAADKDNIASPEEFRKFLRRHLAGDDFVLKVRRGEKIVETRVH